MKFANAVLSILCVALTTSGFNALGLRHRKLEQDVCNDSQILEFDCDIADDVVGVYACRGKKTICAMPSDLLASDTCGCCPGGTPLECSDEDVMGAGSPTTSTITSSITVGDATFVVANATMTNVTMVTNATRPSVTTNSGGGVSAGVCTAAQKMEFDCDGANDVVGVYVCRQGVTTCVLSDMFQASDTCGCCPGDSRLECLDDGDGTVGMEEENEDGDDEEEERDTDGGFF